MMKKNIWILNHYATNTFKDKAGRHYWFAENLIKEGYSPTIFCASTVHNSNENIDTGMQKHVSDNINDIPYVFVKAPDYKGNGKKRIQNMVAFYRNLFPVAKDYAKKHGKPDVILASSVHPLTLVAGIKIAKKFGVPCICEVRDLWPETIVAYGSLKKSSLLAKLLYLGEKWIYKKSDKIIFTLPGGKDYVESIGLDSSKVRYINNGVDFDDFNKNKNDLNYVDADLDDNNKFKILYTGSMGTANELSYLIQAAEILESREVNDIKFILFGDGYQRSELEDFVKNKGMNNVVFKGKVDKKFIPNILSKSNLNVFTGKSIDLYKYGLSLNKMFDYMASGKPTLSNIECGYDILLEYQCGLTVNGGSVEALIEGILKFYKMERDEYVEYSKNALVAAQAFDFITLTNKLEKIILED